MVHGVVRRYMYSSEFVTPQLAEAEGVDDASVIDGDRRFRGHSRV